MYLKCLSLAGFTQCLKRALGKPWRKQTLQIHSDQAAAEQAAFVLKQVYGRPVRMI